MSPIFLCYAVVWHHTLFKQAAEFLIKEPTTCTDFSIFFFWNEILHVSDSSSVHHQEFSTVHTAIVQGDTKNGNFRKTPTKIEEIQEKKLLTETEPLQLAF